MHAPYTSLYAQTGVAARRYQHPRRNVLWVGDLKYGPHHGRAEPDGAHRGWPERVVGQATPAGLRCDLATDRFEVQTPPRPIHTAPSLVRRGDAGDLHGQGDRRGPPVLRRGCATGEPGVHALSGLRRAKRASDCRRSRGDAGRARGNCREYARSRYAKRDTAMRRGDPLVVAAIEKAILRGWPFRSDSNGHDTRHPLDT